MHQRRLILNRTPPSLRNTDQADTVYSMSTTLYWMTHDLRCDDNPALLKAIAGSDRLICVYCLDSQWLRPDRYQSTLMGTHRWHFLLQTLQELDQSLALNGQRLLFLQGDPVRQLSTLIETFKPDRLVVSEQIGVYERHQLRQLSLANPSIEFRSCWTHTLFAPHELPFELAQLPNQFTPFKHAVEATRRAIHPVAAPSRMPPPPANMPPAPLPLPSANILSPFRGGCREALAHLDHYFSQPHAHHYKTTRNALQGWNNSTHFSPWLANGSLSARRIIERLEAYEAAFGSNDSTRWIGFELLWREFFHWYALKHGVRLFHRSGIGSRAPLTSFYPERFRQWSQGNTPWPLVNACMHELNATGFLSNRGRQIAASALINELGVDWRYGAAWFQQQLIDHDLASNWGNWQYIAGVGADPRGGRHFNLAHQAAQFDPDGEYVARWAPEPEPPNTDSRDAADWPLQNRHD